MSGSRFFIDEKDDALKIVAVRKNDRVYAFKYGDLFVVEDIPENYPSIHVWKEPRSDGKTLKKKLVQIGFEIQVDHTDEHWGEEDEP